MIPDNLVGENMKKEDEEKERESQGRAAAGPWVPVDKAIMDYHN